MSRNYLKIHPRLIEAMQPFLILVKYLRKKRHHSLIQKQTKNRKFRKIHKN